MCHREGVRSGPGGGLLPDPGDVDTVSVRFRGLFTFQPQPEAVAAAPLLFQLHALTACLLFAAWPFTRLVHV